MAAPAWLIAALRTIGALVIAYLFVVVLMTAAAQQRVAGALTETAGAERLDYSAALVRLKESEGADRDLAQLRDRRRQLAEHERTALAELARAKSDAETAWMQLDAVVQRAAAAGCPIPNGVPPLAVWGAVVQCVQDGGLPERLRRQIEGANQGPRAFPVLFATTQQAETRAQEIRADLERLNIEVDASEKATSQAKQLQTIFGELNVVRRSLLLGGGLLSEFPPTLMQIILAFVSGAFGALLITLVLIVYPQNQLTFTRGTGVEARVFLGALISLCVYIVLGGGASILGDNQAFDGGQANVMTFSAVGILAGMFSDRVAAWLSGRADMFFRDRDHGRQGEE